MNDKSRWQKEFDALPEWAQKMVRALTNSGMHGTMSARDQFCGMSKEVRKKYDDQVFFVAIPSKDRMEWFEGFVEMNALADALTAPWPPPEAPQRERRVFNVVELMADAYEDGGAFNQPCAFGHRAGGSVYCHNSAWPNSPRKCRRWTGPDSPWGEPHPHKDCPGFVANPDYTERTP